jgi:predicted dehydrogenase
MARVIDRPELALKVLDRVCRDGIRRTREMAQETMTREYATGYSSAGIVIEVGAGVRGLAVGDRVACGGAGYANHAQIVSVPRNLCATVPHGVSLQTAALTTIASVALHGVRLADIRIGDRVAVIGCGLLGQIASRLLQAAGATVFVLDIDADRVRQTLAAGANLGFEASADQIGDVLWASAGIGVDAVIITAACATNDPLILATRIARDRGTVVLVGVAEIDVPRAALFDKELSFRVSRSYGPGRYDPEYEERGLDYPVGYVRWTEQRNMQCILDLQAQGRLTLDDLIDDVLPVDRAAEAYARLTGPAAGRPNGALGFSYVSGGQDAVSARGARYGRSITTPTTDTSGAVSIALIGPGNFAMTVLVPAFVSAGAELTAVYGSSGRSAESALRKAGFRYAADSEGTLLADDAVDAVVIATRHRTHARLTCEALAAGKHVFCEKPLALNERELDDVLAAADASGCILAVGFNRRFSRHLRQVREFAAGAGRPLTAVYRVSAGFIDPKHWVHDLEQGGGRIIGEVCHFFDALTFIVDAPVTEVHAIGFSGPEVPVQARDNVVISASFADDSIATITYAAAGASRVPKERLEIFVDDRTAILDDFRTLELFDGGARTRDRLRTQDKGHQDGARVFLRGVSEGTFPISLDELANAHRACFATLRSLRTNTSVNIAE